MNTPMHQMKIIKEIAIRADQFRTNTEKLGKMAANAFADKHKAQLKGLENIANSALKVSDVLDYIKRQTGKSEQGTKWKKENFGEKLLNNISDLKNDRDRICNSLTISSDRERLEVYLMLIREFIRQVVIFYEFTIS